MTRSSVRCALDDMVLGEDCKEEPDGYTTSVPANVFLPSKDDDRRLDICDDDCVKWMKEFLV